MNALKRKWSDQIIGMQNISSIIRKKQHIQHPNRIDIDENEIIFCKEIFHKKNPGKKPGLC